MLPSQRNVVVVAALMVSLLASIIWTVREASEDVNRLMPTPQHTNHRHRPAHPTIPSDPEDEGAPHHPQRGIPKPLPPDNHRSRAAESEHEVAAKQPAAPPNMPPLPLALPNPDKRDQMMLVAQEHLNRPRLAAHSPSPPSLPTPPPRENDEEGGQDPDDQDKGEDKDDSDHVAGAGSHHVKPTFEAALAKLVELGEVPREMAIAGLNFTNKNPHSREWRVSTDLPRPPFEAPSDIPLEVVRPRAEDTYETLHNAHFWCTGWVTTTDHRVLVTPGKTKRSELLSAMLPEPTPETMGVDSLGSYRYAIAFCDFWSVTYLVFVVDCLPRLMLAYPQLLKQHTDPEHPLYIVSPGEFWAMQMLVEVLGIPREHILLMPSHIIWEISFPSLYATFETLYWIPYSRENLPAGLLELRSKALHRNPPPSPALTAPGGGARVLFTERSDITMPTNHSDVQRELQRLAPTALFQTVRFEAIPVIRQLQLVAKADVLVGPSGGNLVNLLFMRRGAKVVELLSHNVTDQPTDIEQLSRLVGLQYQRHLPERDWERKLQPLFSAPALLQAILSNVSISSQRKASKEVEKVLLNPGPPFVGCQNLFHLPRRRKFIGWFKYGFLIPQWDFVFKFPRQAFWKRVLKEMVVLRNLTGDQIAPAKALCFYEMSMAQTIISGALRRQNVTHRTLDTFVSALAGFHRLWMAHKEWGRFFFYCDAGPKNWAMGMDQKLKMFDFDASYWVVDGVLCSKDRHCGCTLKDKGRPSACQNNRCTYEGLERKVEGLANSWLFSTFRGLWPEFLKDDNTTREVWLKLRQKELVRADIATYLKELAGRFKLDLCQMNLDVPECTKPKGANE